MDLDAWSDWNRLFNATDLPFEFTSNEGKTRLIVEGKTLPERVRTEADPRHAATNASAEEILVMESVTPNLADRLRTSGIQFVDQRGNCFIRQPGLLIDVRGKSSSLLRQSQPNARPRSAMSLFTPRRARVTAALLTQPLLLHGSAREIATHAGTSTGTAHATLSLLVEAGYLEGSSTGYRFINPSGLIDAWAHAYPGALGREIQLFVGSGNFDHIRGTEPLGWISGECAATHLLSGGDTIDLYVPSKEFMSQVIRRARLRKDPDGEISIRQAFWDLDPLATFQRESADRRWPLAPDVVVYADLKSLNDSRAAEVAESVKDQVMKRIRDAENL